MPTSATKTVKKDTKETEKKSIPAVKPIAKNDSKKPLGGKNDKDNNPIGQKPGKTDGKSRKK